MAAYFVVDVRVTDPVAYEQYRQQVAPTLAQYGGRFVVRGGNPQTVEGDWVSERFVVLEFESAERFREWYNSPAYAPLLRLRQDASESRAILVEGV